MPDATSTSFSRCLPRRPPALATRWVPSGDQLRIPYAQRSITWMGALSSSDITWTSGEFVNGWVTNAIILPSGEMRGWLAPLTSHRALAPSSSAT